MNDVGPSLASEEDETSTMRQRLAGSTYDPGPYPLPKEDNKIFIKRQRIAARHEQRRVLPRS